MTSSLYTVKSEQLSTVGDMYPILRTLPPDNNWTRVSTMADDNETGTGNGTDSATDDIWPEETASVYLWQILPPIIFTLGFVGNILNIIIFTRMKFHKRTTLLFVFVMTISDLTVLCTGLSRYWILYMFDLDVRLLSNWGCKINLFVIYHSMQYSSWILVSVTLERFVKIYFPFRCITLMTIRRSLLLLAVLFVSLVLVDGHFFWTNGINGKHECGSLNEIFKKFDEYVFVYIDFAFLAAFPIVIMFILNICIVYKLSRLPARQSTMMQKEDVDKSQRISVKLTRMILFTSTYFLISTTPISIYFILDSYMLPRLREEGDTYGLAQMDLSWSITYLLQYSQYAVNFYLYAIFNVRFRRELCILVGLRGRHYGWKLVSQAKDEQTSSV